MFSSLGAVRVVVWALLALALGGTAEAAFAKREVDVLADGTHSIRGEYLVYFQENATTLAVAQALKALDTSALSRGIAVKKMVTTGGRTFVLVRCHLETALSWQHAEPEQLIAEVVPNALVEAATADKMSCPDREAGNDVPWHLRHLYQKTADVGSTSRFNAAWGTGVEVHVLDSGINCAHSEFDGPCDWLLNTVDTEPAEDLAGHGTSVASLIVGSTLGVARNASVLATKFLGADGFGNMADCLEGLAAIEHYIVNVKKPGVASVINLSFTLVASNTVAAQLNAAIAGLTDAGAVLIGASGNKADHSCLKLPASNFRVISVGSLGVRQASGAAQDYVPDYSNQGSCVDVFAPGDLVNVATANDVNGYHYTYGTSFAAPLVAGMAAAYLTTHRDSTVYEVRTWLLDNAVSGLSGLAAGTADKIAHMPCEEEESHETITSKYHENCFGELFGRYSGASGSIQYPGTGVTKEKHLVCFAVDCPEGKASFTVSYWDVEQYFENDAVYFNTVEGDLQVTVAGYANALPPVPEMTDGAQLQFSSMARLFMHLFTYTGFTVDFTCTAPASAKVFLRVTTGMAEGAPSTQTLGVSLTYADGTSSFGGFFSAGDSHDAAQWTIGNATQPFANVASVTVAAASNATDSWAVDSLSLYHPVAGWTVWANAATGLPAFTLTDVDSSATFSAPAP